MDCPLRSARSVDIPAMLYPVDDHDLAVVVDLIDDSVVAAPGRVQSLEFTQERLSGAAGVHRDGPEDRLDRRCSDLARKAIEMAQTLRADADLVHLSAAAG
jgi:hypothetical protein